MSVSGDQHPDEYRLTGIAGLYFRPEDLQRLVVVTTEDDDGGWQEQWDSSWEHTHLGTSDLSNRLGARIPGLMILHEEIQVPLHIFWKVSIDSGVTLGIRLMERKELNYLAFREASVTQGITTHHTNSTEQQVQPPSGGETAKANVDPGSATANTPNNIQVEARRHRNGSWDLIIRGDEVLYKRTSGKTTRPKKKEKENEKKEEAIKEEAVSEKNKRGGLSNEAFEPKHFEFSSDSRIEVKRFKKGWTIHFLHCGSKSKKAIEGKEPGNLDRDVYEDASYHVLYSPSKTFEHTEYDVVGGEETADAKTYPKYSKQVADKNKEVWETFMLRLKSIVEIAGGKLVWITEESEY